MPSIITIISRIEGIGQLPLINSKLLCLVDTVDHRLTILHRVRSRFYRNQQIHPIMRQLAIPAHMIQFIACGSLPPLLIQLLQNIL